MKTYKITLSNLQISELAELLIDLKKENLLYCGIEENEFNDFQNLLKKVVVANFNCDNENCELKLTEEQIYILLEIGFNYTIDDIQEIVEDYIRKNIDSAPFFDF
jgi:hypothetical protein